MKELTVFLMSIIGIFVYINFIRKSLYLDAIVSSVDSKEYYVRNLPDKDEAANKLAKLSKNLSTLVNSIQDKERKESIERLRDNFNSEQISENIPGSMYVAYSVNKGQELSICIREKETEKFIDDNTVIFVAIHELSHIMSVSTGHTKEFWENMKYLLQEAEKLGLYQSVDYSSTPVTYCGMEINSTPLNL